jgi:hypothetical protein
MKLSKFLHDIMLANKEFDLNFDSFSIGQLQSKEWVVEKMKNVQQANNIDYGIIFNLCGWYGILPAMIWVKDIKFSIIRSFDIDENCKKIADRINRTMLQDSWRFQAVTKDIFDLNFKDDCYELYSYGKDKWFDVKESPNTIINTSCEHTSQKWFNNIPKGKLVILQSNDSFAEEGHINAMTSLEEFEDIYTMYKIYYAGSMKFDKYTRFMLIGIT